MSWSVWWRVGVFCGAATCLGATQATVAVASTYQVIWDPSTHAYGFGGVYDVLAIDALGRLYGEGQDGYGIIFALEPPQTGSGSWPEKTIFDFNVSPVAGGILPSGGVTIVDGRVLGTASEGGTNGVGTAFRLDRTPALAITALHSFASTSVRPVDGGVPRSGLIPGINHLLYGTTNIGGDADQDGTVFSVSSSETKPFYQLLHRFGGPGDGINPTRGRLAVDGEGRLYGTTTLGGANDVGTVFMMQHVSGGWQEQVLYSFQASGDVMQPLANVVLDTEGRVYGCAQGGIFGKGGIFRLTPPDQIGGPWAESVIYTFGLARSEPVAGNGRYGCGITIDPATTRLFGTSYSGGYYGYGTIFEIDPPSPEQTAWTAQLIHEFNGSTRDGRNPVAAPLKVGNTYFGGNPANTIYSFTP